MAAHTVHKETFSDVLRKRSALLIALSALLVLILAFSFVLQTVNARKTDIYPDKLPSVFSLTPVKTNAEEERAVVLTETAPVDESYFADALFCGDSLSDGIRIYEVFAGFDTCTMVGISPQSAATEAFYETEDGRTLTMVETIVEKQPSRVYVMLGTNGLNWASVDTLIAGYSEFLDAVRSQMPALDIIIESIPPTTRETAEKRPSYVIENINAYNAALLELAKSKGCYYLDIHAAVVGADGYLPDEIAAPDGIHFQISGYQIWKDYLFNHTIQGSAAYSIGPDGSMIFTAGTGQTPAEAPPTEESAEGEPAAEGAEATAEGEPAPEAETEPAAEETAPATEGE